MMLNVLVLGWPTMVVTFAAGYLLRLALESISDFDRPPFL